MRRDPDRDLRPVVPAVIAKYRLDQICVGDQDDPVVLVEREGRRMPVLVGGRNLVTIRVVGLSDPVALAFALVREQGTNLAQQTVVPVVVVIGGVRVGVGDRNEVAGA